MPLRARRHGVKKLVLICYGNANGSNMAQRSEMTRESAETVAIEALAFIAGEPERLDRFMALTGLGSESLRKAAKEAGFLLGVLDHVMADDRLLVEFATQYDMTPERVVQARERLAGPQSATL